MNMYVNSDIAADAALEEIRDIEATIERLKKVSEGRIEGIKSETNNKIEIYLKVKQDIMAQLRAYTLTIQDQMKHTKTQAKYVLPVGTIVIKKPKKTLEANKDELLKWAKENDTELIKAKTTETVDWAGLKKDLEIAENGQVYRKSTGEILEEVVQVKETAEELEVKF